MNLQPNDPLRLDDADVEFATLRIREMGLLGDGVAIFEEDEIPVFGGLVGELVKARIYRYSRRKKNLITAIVIEVIESSPKGLNLLASISFPVVVVSGSIWNIPPN